MKNIKNFNTFLISYTFYMFNTFNIFSVIKAVKGWESVGCHSSNWPALIRSENQFESGGKAKFYHPSSYIFAQFVFSCQYGSEICTERVKARKVARVIWGGRYLWRGGASKSAKSGYEGSGGHKAAILKYLWSARCQRVQSQGIGWAGRCLGGLYKPS